MAFKYEDQGAYHWRFTYSGRLRRFDPRNHARYDIPLRLLAPRVHATAVGLEIGCGDGVLLYKSMLAGRRMVGVDLSAEGLALAKKEIVARTHREPIVVHASGYELPFQSGAFDFVVSVEVIEHLDDVERYLAEIARVLKAGGLFSLTTPHKLPKGGVQDPYHVREYDAGELRDVLGHHFREVQVHGMYPKILDRLYYGATGVVPVDKVARGAFKLFARYVYNPYLYTAPGPGGRHWANLAALCVKA